MFQPDGHFPTVLELIGMAEGFVGRVVRAVAAVRRWQTWLSRRSSRSAFSPMAEKSISAVRYPEKYPFDAGTERQAYDLAKIR
jgi:hypothetical protein